MSVVAGSGQSLPLTGERTVPGIPEENYWFRRHEAAYEWVATTFAADLAGARVIDAGCGEGYGTDLLAAAGSRPLGLELEHLAAAHAGARYGDRIAVCEANLDAFPVADDAVGAVVSMQVIEHLWDLPGFLGECLRALRPGGLCVLSTPNRLTFSPGLERGQKPTNPFHVEEFDAAQLVGLVRDAGFGDVVAVGLAHGSRLGAWEATHGGLVDAQIAAALSPDPVAAWTPELRDAVAAITTADFRIDSTSLETCADLIVVARKPEGRVR